jgi:signal transduction histidine kinase
MQKHKQDMRTRIRKELVLIGTLAVFLSIVSITLGYLLLRGSALRTATEHNSAISQLAAGSVMDIMDHEFSVLKTHARWEACEDIIKAVNAAYPADEKERQVYINQMKRASSESSRANPAIKGYLTDKVAPALSSDMIYGNGLKDIMVTDKFGGVIASTHRDKEPYQGDKDWWQLAFDKGRGDFAVGEVIFDENSASWCFPFAGPVKDRKGETIGVYRVLVGIDIFFNPIRDMRIGRTGKLAIVDSRNYLLFYPGINPFDQKLCDYKELQKLLTSKTAWAIMNRIFGYSGPVLATFAKVNNPLLIKRGIDWEVIVIKDSGEIYSGLDRFIAWASILCLVLICLAIFLTAHIFRNLFMRPTQKLEEWIRHIGAGDLNYRMNVKDGESIKELADSLHAMADELKKNTVSAALLREEANKCAKMEEEFKNREENLEQLIKNQLVQPILSLQHAAAILKEDAPIQVSERPKHALDGMIRSAAELKNAVEKLAYITSIDSGTLELKMEHVDARALLKNVVLAFESKISGRGLEFRLDIPKEAADVLADPVKINDVLNILLDNALKATEKGRIEVSTRYLPNEVEFSVSDTGHGIPNEALGALFNRSRASGISLFIAKGIIEAHKGHIFVESQANKITRFTFRLPKSKKG